MVKVWFISDTHFGHMNMLKFTKADGTLVRPEFDDVETMDRFMVDKWQSTVQPQDHIYHLGDVSMGQPGLAWIKQLHGHKRLVRGNHDIFKTKFYIQAGFEEIYGSRVLGNVLFTHIPVHPACMGRFKGNAHGHIHANPDLPGRYLNLSVEAIGYTPIILEEVVARLEAKRQREECPIEVTL